jgi:predicted enzyme related to lactoylglutathione lyase
MGCAAERTAAPGLRGVRMLSKSMTTTMLPVTDMDRASEFYETRLGLHHRTTGVDGSRIFDTGSGAIGLREVEAGAQSRYTVLSFEVADLGAEIRDLENRGVRFEDYDLPELKTVDHIATMGNERAAWFQDTEGNILCIHEVTNGG